MVRRAFSCGFGAWCRTWTPGEGKRCGWCPQRAPPLSWLAPRVVPRAADHVAAALTTAGFIVESVISCGDLSDAFEGFSQDMAEFEISRDGQTAGLQLVRFDRHRSPVMMEIGPALHVEGRRVGHTNALRTYPRQRLVELAHQADPDLDNEEISNAMLRLDDSVFTEQYRLSSAQVAQIRQAFSPWPRP